MKSILSSGWMAVLLLLADAVPLTQSFVLKPSTSARTSLGELSAGLKPPMSTEEMLSKEGKTASMYDEHVQKTYG